MAKSRVTRAPKAGATRAMSAGPRKSAQDLAENRAPRRGAGLTKTGSNTPFPSKGRNRSSAPPAPKAVRDPRSKGLTLPQQAAKNGQARKAAG